MLTKKKIQAMFDNPRDSVEGIDRILRREPRPIIINEAVIFPSIDSHFKNKD